jgi:phosphoribosylanthranilate isomerase
MRPFHVKICGITRLEDALAAAKAGADSIGLNFYAKSPRRIDPARAAEIVRALPEGVEAVGVFVNEPPERVNALAEQAALHMVQLHGDESPEDAERVHLPVIKALRLRGEEDIAAAERYKVDLYLLDTPSEIFGGTGQTHDWLLAAKACRRLRAFLAGGLTPDNVAEAVRAVNPYGVDVAGGVESAPGIKDPARIAAFIQAAREAARTVRGED